MPSYPASRYPRKIEPALPPPPLTIARGITDVADSTAMQVNYRSPLSIRDIAIKGAWASPYPLPNALVTPRLTPYSISKKICETDQPKG